MRALASAFILLLGPGALLADGRTELDILRARCTEQERQIRALEKEIESLHSQLALERRRSRGVDPSAAPASPLPPTPAPAYVVKAGDTISSISRRYHTSADVLMKNNGIDDATRLRVGQKLLLPKDARIPQATPVAASQTPTQPPAATPSPRANAGKKAASTSAGKKPSSYQVQRGDTLFGIARTHSMSVNQLRALNPKVGDKIIVGQTITLSGKPASTTQSTAASPAPSKSQTQTIATRSTSKPTPKPTPPAKKPAPAPAPVAKMAPASTPKPKPEPAPAAAATEDHEVATTASNNEPSPPAPKSISSIIVMDEVTLGALAGKHGTTTAQLNALNNWNYKSDLILARGSEVYVPVH